MTVLLVAMFSDVIDDIEMKTGKRLEGTVFSFRSLVNKIAIAIFNVFMLTAFGAIGLLLQSIPMFFYKFDEKAQEGKLKAFREEKERREIEELNRLAQETEVK